MQYRHWLLLLFPFLPRPLLSSTGDRPRQPRSETASSLELEGSENGAFGTGSAARGSGDSDSDEDPLLKETRMCLPLPFGMAAATLHSAGPPWNLRPETAAEKNILLQTAAGKGMQIGQRGLFTNSRAFFGLLLRELFHRNCRCKRLPQACAKNLKGILQKIIQNKFGFLFERCLCSSLYSSWNARVAQTNFAAPPSGAGTQPASAHGKGSRPSARFFKTTLSMAPMPQPRLISGILAGGSPRDALPAQ